MNGGSTGKSNNTDFARHTAVDEFSLMNLIWIIFAIGVAFMVMAEKNILQIWKYFLCLQ